jgi:hypothetical protein
LPYTIGWLIDRRVMGLEARGVMTEYELRTLMEDCSRLSLKGTKPTYMIVDALELRRTNFGAEALRQVTGIRCGHDLVVVATTNLVLSTLARTAAIIFEKRVVVTATIGDAKVTISQHDPSVQFP